VSGAFETVAAPFSGVGGAAGCASTTAVGNAISAGAGVTTVVEGIATNDPMKA